MSASPLQKLLLAGGTCALCLVGAEIVQRVRTGWDSGEVALRLETLRDEALGRWADADDGGAGQLGTVKSGGRAYTAAPYVGFDFDNAGEILGRDLERQRTSTGEPFRILVLGGSVAANFAYHGKARLFEVLAKDPRLADKRLELFMYARPSHKQPQQLTQAATLFSAGLLPDLVLNLDGFNEVAIAVRNASLGIHPIQPSRGQWLPLLEGTRRAETRELLGEAYRARDLLLQEVEAALESPRLFSALFGPPMVRSVYGRREQLVEASDALVAGLGAPEQLPSALTGPKLPPKEQWLSTSVDLWSESSRSLKALCDVRGIPYVHVLQPTLHDDGSKPLTEEEIATSQGPAIWMQSVRIGYPLLRAGGERLRSEHGVRFLDASLAFVALEEPVYYDVCHFRRPGHEVLAEFLAPALLDALP